MSDLTIVLAAIDRLRADIKDDTNRLHDRVDNVEEKLATKADTSALNALESKCQPLTGGTRKKGDHWWQIFSSPLALLLAFLLLFNLAQMAALIWMAVRTLPGVS